MHSTETFQKGHLSGPTEILEYFDVEDEIDIFRKKSEEDLWDEELNDSDKNDVEFDQDYLHWWNYEENPAIWSSGSFQMHHEPQIARFMTKFQIVIEDDNG